MSLTLFLQFNPLALITTCVILGLLVGSFLNVVVHRLPIMLEREWRSQAAELAGKSAEQTEKYNLVLPRSRCPNCGHPISAIENIPLLSYLALRGRCRACAAPISPRYFAVELLSGILSGAVAWHFGYGWPLLGALILGWGLIALAAIDLEKQLLPDRITLFLLWAGLLFNVGHAFTDLRSAVIGAVTGYMSLWCVYHVFRGLTGKEGMGYGDFKLFALIGAWLGWQALPMVILLSATVGALVGISLLLTKRLARGTPMPFGPYLAAAGWIALLWGRPLMAAYMGTTPP